MVIAVIAGAVLGFLAGLGIGGGSLLILWLTMVAGMETGKAQSVNLLFFLTAAGSVTLFRWKKGTLHLERILPAIICGSLAAAVFSWAASSWNTDVLKKMFGVLLLATGARELLYRP